MIKYYIAAFLAVFLTALCQLLLKLGASRTGGISRVYVNPFTMAAYAMLLAVTLLNLYAYKALPLKMSAVILPFTYPLVAAFSFIFLKEKATRSQLLGAVLIIIGIFIFNLNLI